MGRRFVKPLTTGALIALGTLGLAWFSAAGEWFNTDRWRIVALILLGGELIFLLFIPANKGGQQFGPHGWGGSSPLVSAGAEFEDRHPSRRRGDMRWLIASIPIVVSMTGVAITLSF